MFFCHIRRSLRKLSSKVKLKPLINFTAKMSLLNSSIPITFNQLYLNGAYSASHSSESISILNPKDNTLVADGIPIADDVDVDNAVRFAEAAFNGPWSKFSATERSACFHRLINLLEEKLPEILRLDSLTTGNPVSLIPTRESNYIRNCLLYYGRVLRELIETF